MRASDNSGGRNACHRIDPKVAKANQTLDIRATLFHALATQPAVPFGAMRIPGTERPVAPRITNHVFSGMLSIYRPSELDADSDTDGGEKEARGRKRKRPAPVTPDTAGEKRARTESAANGDSLTSDGWERELALVMAATPDLDHGAADACRATEPRRSDRISLAAVQTVAEAAGIRAAWNDRGFPALRLYTVEEGARACVSLFENGKFTCMGASTEKVAHASIARVHALVQQTLDQNGSGLAVEACDVTRKLCVGMADVGFKVHVDKLVGLKGVSYETEQFAGAVLTMEQPPVVCRVFNSGKVIYTKATTPEQIREAHERLGVILWSYHTGLGAAGLPVESTAHP